MQTEQTLDIYGIVLDSTQSRLLIWVDEAGNWSLPHIHLSDERRWFSSAEHLKKVSGAMQNLLKADVSVVRNVYSLYSDNQSHVDLIYELEINTPNWMPPAQNTWITQNELARLRLEHPEHQTVIDGVLQEAVTNSVPLIRPPWARPGWFSAASAWMQGQLKAQRYELIGPIEQFKSWGISCVLCAQTDRGRIFFKVASSLPLFCNEPVVQTALSERYPDVVPAPIAIERDQRWMLMADFGPELRSMQTLERWESVARRFGELQVRAVSRVESLLSIGCLDRRLDVLSAQIDPLLNDDDLPGLLSIDEIAQVRSLAPHLKALCNELARYAVPYSLNHGDLHSGNIAGESLLIFDWTDACITHPFFDLITLMHDVEDLTPNLDERETVLDAYLQQWTAYEPMERLRELWRLAAPLGALHQAVSYQHIVATLEPTSKPDSISGVPNWLRRVMQKMPD